MLHPVTVISSRQAASEYPEQHFLDLCKKEISIGFKGQDWMLLRVPIEYRNSILAKLVAGYSMYEISAYEVTGIWISVKNNVNNNVK
jgi:hypothetical protein